MGIHAPALPNVTIRTVPIYFIVEDLLLRILQREQNRLHRQADIVAGMPGPFHIGLATIFCPKFEPSDRSSQQILGHFNHASIAV